MYYLYALATAPGVIIHEFGHLIFCLLARVPVHRVKLFRFGNPAGYVIHDDPTKFFPALFISYGPLIFNSAVTLLCFSQVASLSYHWRPLLFLWLGAASALHAIPSTQDAKSLFQTTNRRFWKNPLVVLGYPFILTLYILNLLKKLHLPIVYMIFLWWLGAVYFK